MTTDRQLQGMHRLQLVLMIGLLAWCPALLVSADPQPQPTPSPPVACSFDDTVLPCTFGGCTFHNDTDGLLTRTGACPSERGTLYLSSLRTLDLSFNLLSSFPTGFLDTCSSLRWVRIYKNQLPTASAADYTNDLPYGDAFDASGGRHVSTAALAGVFDNILARATVVLSSQQVIGRATEL